MKNRELQTGDLLHSMKRFVTSANGRYTSDDVLDDDGDGDVVVVLTIGGGVVLTEEELVTT